MHLGETAWLSTYCQSLGEKSDTMIEEYECVRCGWTSTSRPLFQEHVDRHLMEACMVEEFSKMIRTDEGLCLD
jgi:hypothetical protein